MIRGFYDNFKSRIDEAKTKVKRPLTLTEKILYAHLNRGDRSETIRDFAKGIDYVYFNPDRVAMQDATAQMALLQFMQAGKSKTSVPTTVHCDHLIQAKEGASDDLTVAKDVNKEVYDFLFSVSNKYNIGFWKPGAGIIHQVIMENYAFPGGMMIGTDSHTVNAGGLGMIAVGVGGADAVDVMAGMSWELKFPRLIGVKLMGEMNEWTSAKDVILKLAGMLTVKGGTGCVVEYFGPGAKKLSCTGKGTVCNMGAEIGATTSTFCYDDSMERYLMATGRSEIADLANDVREYLRGDAEVYADPKRYFDEWIEIDLSSLEPHINGPFSPDIATPLSEMKNKVRENHWPKKVSVGLIGSCTNSSYEDIARSASIAKQAEKKGLKAKSSFSITPGSEQVRYTVERDGFVNIFKKINAKVFANACGPCIGQWRREGSEKREKNTIVHSFNRNFSKRNDGNPNTYAFVASPEIVTALAIAGEITFNPITDTLINERGEKVQLDPPQGDELPKNGFDVKDNGYQSPSPENKSIKISINPDSQRLQMLKPFPPFQKSHYGEMKLLIKVRGKCTTDHISMAGPWLKYRGHLDNISNNLLIGATNSFNKKINSIKNQLSGIYQHVPDVQRSYQKEGIHSIVVGDENYGEGSSREHAAMEPRHLGVKVVLVRSFARIHETNLKKQGILALTFANIEDYEKIEEDDTIAIVSFDNFSPNSSFDILLKHSDDRREKIIAHHTYSENQIQWFWEGSSLNLIKKQSKSPLLN